MFKWKKETVGRDVDQSTVASLREEIRYISNISQEKIKATADGCIFIDSGIAFLYALAEIRKHTAILQMDEWRKQSQANIVNNVIIAG